MAGIISNVDDDVQKLRKLKNEIENVKKALKGINITVDIDIAKGLQSQLTSLLSQYDALVDKVAVAEGKIMLSTKRINDAAEKIIKAQEKISKSVGVPAQTGNVNVQANTAETASIQAQAKAYDDLKAEIDGILGARDANVKRMVDEMNAIRLINAEIKKITKLQGDASLLSSAQQKRLEQLNNSLLTHKAALSDVRQTLNNNVRLDNASATSMNGISQSLSRMRVAYRELTEEERNSPFGKELLASINQADIKIKELDATIGNHQRNVGNYGKQWDGLSMSIQQVGRELPSLAYGPKVFFSAISNNIPILADEIKRARTEYELLKKSGQAATPVWKQVVSSLFSWQSALTVGITLLTLYGDKVVDWVAGLSKAKEAIKELLSAEQEMALARKKAISDSTKERAELDLLYNKLKGTSLSTKERTAAVNEWMKKYPQHSNIMNGELVSLGKLESAYQSLSKQIIESAKARSYSDRITELESKRFDANFKRLNQKKSLGIAESEYLRTKEIYEKLQKDYDSGKSVGQALSTTRVSYMNAKEEYEKQKEIYANLEKETNDYASKINYIAEQIKVDDLYPQPEEGTHDYWQQQVQIADVALKQIDSKQKALLDNAVKDPKKDLYGLGIDKYIVDSYKQAIKLKTEAEKELKVYDSSSKQENQADKLRKEQDKFNVLLDKQALEQQRSAEDLQMKVDEARIKAMDEGSAKTIAEMELNFKKEMQAIDRQKEDALRKKIEDARNAWDANPKNAKKSFDGSGIKLTDDEQKSFDELYQITIANNEKTYKDLANQYLSYADERLAIEKKFNDDIAVLHEARKKAEAKGDTNGIAKIDRSIGKRTETKNEDVFNLDAEQFKKSMDWEQVFGNLDKVSTDTLKKLKGNLKDFISAQKDLSPENLKELVEALEKIDDKVTERNPFDAMSSSFKSLKEATDAQREAQEAYNKALKEGTSEEQKNAKSTLESAKNTKQKALYDANTALHKGVDEIGQYVDAGNQVIGIMETLGIKTPEWLEGTMSGFGEMLNGLGNIDLMKPMSIITGSLQTVKGALTSVISLGGLIPGLDGADYSHYNEMVEEYNKLNEIWDELIDKKLEYINTSYGAEADKVGKEALELVNKSIEAYRILGRERLNSGASAGSHSIGKRMAKNTSSSDWQDIARALDMSVKDAKDFIGTGRMTGLFDLTTEQLEKLKSEAPTFWAKLDGDVRDYLDKIIEGEERIEEIHNQINEQLTQTTFDSVYSNFIDTLMDMKASSKDAAEDISEYFMQAMLSEQIGTLYQDKLKKWYEKFAKGMEDGSLTESERNALNNEYMGYIEEAMKLRDELAAATGYDKISQESTSQSSASRGFGTEMTHEDAGELSGRFTALQIAGEEIKNQNIIQSQSLNLLTVKADALLSINTETRNIADDTRDLIAQSYLELVQISENTGAIVKPIIQIQKDMAEVKNNTSKL